jgi:glycosyltransferase involved in cell wall biosynthesis
MAGPTETIALVPGRTRQRRICFVGGARYSWPLDLTSEKKFRALQQLGNISVIGFSQDILPRTFNAYGQFYLLPQLPHALLRYAEMFFVVPIIAFWLIARHGVGVLVAQSPYEGFPAAVAKKVARCLGINVTLIVESHGDFVESVFLQRRVAFARLHRFLMRRVGCFALKQADILRAVSEFTQGQLAQWAPGKRIFQFPAWTDMDVFLAQEVSADVNSVPEFLYAGVLIPRKGVHLLVNAFAQVVAAFPQARLVIVGKEENESYAARLKQQVRNLNLAEQVAFVSEVSQTELASRMRHACAFVLPSISEGFGRVVLEAMACGRPVIGSRLGGIAELIEDERNGFLVAPGDEAALSDRLRWILENRKRAVEMGQNGRLHAQSIFSAEKYVRAYEELLDAAQKRGE